MSQGAVVVTLTAHQDRQSDSTDQVVSKQKQLFCGCWYRRGLWTPELMYKQKQILYQLFINVENVFPDRNQEIGNTTIKSTQRRQHVFLKDPSVPM